MEKPGSGRCLQSTIRAALFNDQNCRLTLDASGDLLITYLDGDAYGIKRKLSLCLNSLMSLTIDEFHGGIIVQFGLMLKTSEPDK